MKVRVKICGIRSMEAARASVKYGADFLGFNFVKSSRRYIEPLKAKEIIGELTAETKVVGIFQNEKVEKIKKTIDLLKLDFVQLHGNEPPSYGQLTQYAGVIKTFSLAFGFETKKVMEEMEAYNVDFFLLDRENQGEGEMIHMEKAKEISEKFPIFLAGGLTVENVGERIRIIKPFAVDAAGGIETEGEEDTDKIRQFIQNVKGVL